MKLRLKTIIILYLFSNDVFSCFVRCCKSTPLLSFTEVLFCPTLKAQIQSLCSSDWAMITAVSVVYLEKVKVSLARHCPGHDYMF